MSTFVEPQGAVGDDRPATARQDPRTLMSYSREAESVTWRILALVAVIAVVWAVFQVVSDGVFITPRNISNLSVQVSVTTLVTIGVTWLLVARQIDLSSGALVALIVVMIAQSETVHQWGFAVSLLIALGIGLASGLLNGILVTYVGIPAFIATLGAFSYLRGSGYLVADGATVSGFGTTMFRFGNEGLSPGVSVIVIAAIVLALLVPRVRHMIATSGRGGFRPAQLLSVAAIVAGGLVAIWAFGAYRGLPYPVVVVMIAVAIAMFVSTQTRFGRHIYAVGGDPEAARRAGIKSRRIIIALFVIAGLLTALGAMIQAARLDSGPPSTGNLLEMGAISAAVIGGTSLFGGRGSIVGSVLGALLIGSIANGLSITGVNTFWQLVVTGILLVVAVATDRRTRKESSL